MIVPYMNRKIRDDFSKYIVEYRDAINGSIKGHSDDTNGFMLFKIMYPLLVLLESLTTTEYFIDPSGQILLEEYIITGDKDLALKQIRKTTSYSSESVVLRQGVLKRIFTPFLEELYSDIMLLLNNYYVNNYRGCYISMRCVLEDLYRHLFYKDHPEEFTLIKSGMEEHSIGIRPVVLREYLQRVSYLKKLKNRDRSFDEITDGNDVFKWNGELYSKTSFFVHASSPKAMSTFATNMDLSPDADEQIKAKELAQEIVELCSTFLVLGHIDYFRRFNDYVKALVLNAYPDSAKFAFRKLVNV